MILAVCSYGLFRNDDVVCDVGLVDINSEALLGEFENLYVLRD